MSTHRTHRDFKVGDRVRYVGRYIPFYVSPKPYAEGVVIEVPPVDSWVDSSVRVAWGDRLRYCKDTDTRIWHMAPHELEFIKDTTP